MTPQARAAKSAEIMMAQDPASRELGMQIIDIAPGAASMTMRVTPKMLNGHQTCHGGYIFTLADSAFAFACNSYNRMTVAQQNQITYIAPAKVDELLTATATETAMAGRSGVYDVMVSAEDGRTIATMRGLSRTIKGQLFPEEGDIT
ncbi:hydroxyphenylacetyl-CoA thioesterase PaaI [Sulfitobacter sp. F26169L]|uniref:hydroxyphenylacetyl-CoA thioesterase PaaI n=1 Tax=Sulfitobacter sp. F26169L TaxID=2996015 RepID=UPI002260D02F|nr:hydroxyphenylacetyl-CoA thioesterase PaaI [Sulfitobacter sp. F26169L]MCX7565703.1 hydroxyphenylacetyl-CoA thioesterase PaaI [Sulfitobacter sp. F26169L]